MDEHITITRHPYEEPYYTRLFISASNGLFSGYLQVFIDIDDLVVMADALEKFPLKAGEEYKYVLGSEDQPETYAYLFVFRAHTRDSLGHSAIDLSMMDFQGTAKFSIEADPLAINKLGKSLRRMKNFEKCQLVWTPEETKFFDHYQD